jgi:hypothetical protein
LLVQEKQLFESDSTRMKFEVERWKHEVQRLQQFIYGKQSTNVHTIPSTPNITNVSTITKNLTKPLKPTLLHSTNIQRNTVKSRRP